MGLFMLSVGWLMVRGLLIWHNNIYVGLLMLSMGLLRLSIMGLLMLCTELLMLGTGLLMLYKYGVAYAQSHLYIHCLSTLQHL